MYELYKIKLQQLIESNFNLKIHKEDEQKYIIRQQETPLFRQLNVLRKSQDNRMHEIVLVEAKHNKKRLPDLKKLLNEGFKLNGISYVRIGKSSSQAKDGITVFINEKYYDEMMKRSQLGLKVSKVVVSKYESYRNLILSSCQTVEDDLPYIVIVDEYEKTIENQYIRYASKKDVYYTDKVTGEEKIAKDQRFIKEGYKDIGISPFDGFGVHDKKVSRKINNSIGTRKDTVLFQIRLPFMKGVTVEFDFKKFYRERKVKKIKDVFGKWHNVKDIDCIWNTSMWKGCKYFRDEFGNNGWDKYLEKVNEFGFQLGISKYNHHMDDINHYSRLNFQYLQCLDLINPKYVRKFKDFDTNYDILDANNWGKIINVAEYSTRLVEKIIKGDKLSTLKFLGINNSEEDVKSKYVEAVMINDKMLKDPNVKKMLKNKLDKTINEMKFGKIYARGFYHTVIGDVIGYLEYAAGLDIKGCLNAGEFHANTLDHGECLSMRSPLVDPSEVNKVNLVHNDVTNKYFRHLHKKDVCMINMYDLTQQQQGGMDQDGDAIFLCNDEILINSKIEAPVVVDVEDKATVEPVEYNKENIINYECKSRDSRIGEITNIATSILNQYTEDENWIKINKDNVSLLRLFQGKEIDYLKTGFRWIITRNLRNYLKKLPYFILYNYPKKLTVYRRIGKINKGVDRSEKVKHNAFKSPTPMNELCDYICQWEKRNIVWDNTLENNGHLLIDKSLSLSDKDIMKKIRKVNNGFSKDLRMAIENDEDLKILSQDYYSQLKEIISDEELLSNYCIKVSYKSISSDKTLCWMMFGDVMLNNLKNNSGVQESFKIVETNSKDNDGEEFLGKYYKLIN